jgi:hypothetical protein
MSGTVVRQIASRVINSVAGQGRTANGCIPNALTI